MTARAPRGPGRFLLSLLRPARLSPLRGAQVTTPYDFTAAMRVSVREFAPSG
jgi:hypothetical protein